MPVMESLAGGILFFDGGMGSMLQTYGLPVGEQPELFNLTKPEAVTEIHLRYLEAGSHIISANTFGASCIRFQNADGLIRAAIENAKSAVKQYGADGERYIALDIGPCGKLLEPMGDLTVEACYEAYKEAAVSGERYGADLVILETFSDIYELKTAILAVKENTALPVICSMTFDQSGRSLTGCGVDTFAHVALGLGVDALGINCGMGPEQAATFFDKLIKCVGDEVPIIVQPNAGLPEMHDGKASYSLTHDDFATAMAEIRRGGARILGGCCGTTPNHIHKMATICVDISPEFPPGVHRTAISSYNKTVYLDESPVMDARVNFKENASLRAGQEVDIDAVVDSAMDARDDDVDIIVVNMSGCMHEEEVLARSVFAIQEMLNIPLLICSQNPKATERALRLYNGRAGVSYSGASEQDAELIARIAEKYGGVVI